MAEKVWVTDENTGLPALVPERWLKHPTLSKTLRLSHAGNKPRIRLTEPAIDTAEAVEEFEEITLPKPMPHPMKKED